MQAKPKTRKKNTKKKIEIMRSLSARISPIGLQKIVPFTIESIQGKNYNYMQKAPISRKSINALQVTTSPKHVSVNSKSSVSNQKNDLAKVPDLSPSSLIEKVAFLKEKLLQITIENQKMRQQLKREKSGNGKDLWEVFSRFKNKLENALS